MKEYTWLRFISLLIYNDNFENIFENIDTVAPMKFKFFLWYFTLYIIYIDLFFASGTFGLL